jgi:hypothetical protein
LRILAPRIARFRFQKLTPLDFFPTVSDQQIGRDQFGFLPEYQRLRRTVLLDHSFDGDAGIDDQRVHRSSRPSRSRTSEGVCFRRFVSFRRSAANDVKTRLDVADKSLAEDFPMLGFGGAAVPCRTTLQSSDQIVIQITEIIDPTI